MKIDNSLRQECMPEMVYSICKLAGYKSYTKEELKSLITLNNSDSPNYNKVYNFALECEFLSENLSGTINTNFSDKELSCFRNFRYAIFRDVFKDSNNIFTNLTRWYLTQSREILSVKSAEDFQIAIPREQFGNISKEYVLGFRFWLSALGLAMLQKAGVGRVAVFATNSILLDWIEFEKPFKKGKSTLARDFITKLIQDCPAFSDCTSENSINLALSMGLRVLHQNEIIELKYTADSSDVWHLIASINSPNTNNISEIIVR